VASILLAFAIDAAWDARNEQLRRDALLVALEREMAFAAAERDRVAVYHTVGRDATAALLMLDARVPHERLSAQTVDSLLQLAWGNTATFDAPSGALSGLLVSSNLDLIDDEALLVEVTSYPGHVANLSREQEYLVEVGFRLLDYLGAAGVDLSLLNEPTIDPSLSTVPWGIGRTVAYSLAGDAHFRSLLNELWWRYDNSIKILDEMRRSIEQIRLLSGPDRAP